MIWYIDDNCRSKLVPLGIQCWVEDFDTMPGVLKEKKILQTITTFFQDSVELEWSVETGKLKTTFLDSPEARISDVLWVLPVRCLQAKRT